MIDTKFTDIIVKFPRNISIVDLSREDLERIKVRSIRTHLEFIRSKRLSVCLAVCLSVCRRISIACPLSATHSMPLLA